MTTLFMLTPVMFNFKQSFGIGYFRVEKVYTVNHGNGYAGVRVLLNIDQENGITYHVITSISTISSGDVNVNGIIYSINSHYDDDRLKELKEYYYDPPINFIRFDTGYLIAKGSICNSTGIIELQSIYDSEIFNDTINYKLTYTIPFDLQDYYHLDFVIYALFFAWLLSFIFVPFIIHRIFRPVFGISENEEDFYYKVRKYQAFFKKKEKKEEEDEE